MHPPYPRPSRATLEEPSLALIAADGGDRGVTAPTTRMMAELTIFVG